MSYAYYNAIYSVFSKTYPANDNAVLRTVVRKPCIINTRIFGYNNALCRLNVSENAYGLVFVYYDILPNTLSSRVHWRYNI